MTDALERALIQAGELVRDRAISISPIDTGQMVNSTYVRLIGPGTVKVGYEAYYAPFVHRMPGKLKGKPRRRPGATGNYWDPHGQPRFLEIALEQSKDEIIQLIRDAVVEDIRVAFTTSWK